MGRNKRNLVVALSLISVLTTGIANAQGNDARLKVNLKDADLLTATKMIAERTGVQFYFKSQKAFNRVTLQVENQTADDVIRFICDAAGAFVTKNDAGVYVISADAPVTESVVAEGKTKARIFRKVKMLHAGADDIFNRVVLNRMLDPMAKQKELMRAIDLVKANNLSNGLSNSPAYNLYDQFVGTNQFTPKPQATASTPTAGNEGNSIELPGEKSKQMGGMMGGGGMGGGMMGGGMGGGMGQGMGGGMGGGMGQGMGGGMGQGGGSLVPGQGLVPDTIDHISFDPTDNSLIIQGTSEDDINTLQNIIAQFDVAPKQVQVRVEFITTSENLDRSLGFGIEYNRGSLVAGMNQQDFIRASDPVFLTYATGDAVLRLRTRLSEGSGRVVTAPTLRTLNNTPAMVSAFTTDYILSAQTQVTQGVLNTVVNPLPIQVGTFLTVNPRINGDGYITMGLSPNVAGITGTRSVALSNNVTSDLPIITQQSVSAVVRIKNRDTIVIGGMNTESVNTTVNRVPVLADLPILGQFFRRTAKGKTSSELLIFVTPTIIEEDEEGPLP
jgi:general secretion pathway protein D